MPHAVSLGLEIALVVLVWFNFDGYILYDFEAVCFQAYTLHRVVGEQAHLVYAQVAEHLGTAAVVALVGLEAQVNVGIHGVVSFFLQFLGGNLVHQSYASSFLLHVDNYSLACLVYHLHCLVQLLSAVASLAA